LEQRIREAAKLGFKTVVVSKFSSVQIEEKNIRVQAFEKIEEVVAFLFS
jgi:predicted ATP-dependent serine protease